MMPEKPRPYCLWCGERTKLLEVLPGAFLMDVSLIFRRDKKKKIRKVKKDSSITTTTVKAPVMIFHCPACEAELRIEVPV